MIQDHLRDQAPLQENTHIVVWVDFHQNTSQDWKVKKNHNNPIVVVFHKASEHYRLHEIQDSQVSYIEQSEFHNTRNTQNYHQANHFDYKLFLLRWVKHDFFAMVLDLPADTLNKTEIHFMIGTGQIQKAT